MGDIETNLEIKPEQEMEVKLEPDDSTMDCDLEFTSFDDDGKINYIVNNIFFIFTLYLACNRVGRRSLVLLEIFSFAPHLPCCGGTQHCTLPQQQSEEIKIL